MGADGPASAISSDKPASLDLFGISLFLSGAEAGVCIFEDSITTSSTLAILLVFVVIAGILDIFGNSGSCGGLRVFGCSTDLLGYDFSVVFSLVSAGRFSTSTGSVFSCSAITIGYGTSANSTLSKSGVLWLNSKKRPFSKLRHFGCFNIPGSVRQNFNLFPFGVVEIAEVATFLFFPCFHEG
jgi:hypothetical protein